MILSNMRIRISIEAQHVPGKGRELDEAYQNAWDEISAFVSDREALRSWTLPFEDAATIKKAKSVFEIHIPKYAKPIFEYLCIDDLTAEDFLSASFLIFGIVGDDASGLDIIDSSNIRDFQYRQEKCSECGNFKIQHNPDIRIDARKSPQNKVLFSFVGALSVFCRREFVELYEESGLSGLSFQKLSIFKSDADELFFVKFRSHNWNDRVGVCDVCSMKTNVRGVQFFNLRETYFFDFQYVKVFDRVYFVISKQAVEFLGRLSHTEMRFSHGVVWPGLFENLIRPENRRFSFGECPTQVLV